MKFENEEELIAKVKALSGAVSTCHYHKDLEPKKTLVKKFGDIGKIEKKSVFQVRAGIDYENIKTVKEKHESGEVERKGLPESMEKRAKGVYKHKYKGSYYIGCQPLAGKNPNSVHTSDYYLDGEKVELDTIIVEDKTFGDFLYAKDLPKDDDREWINLDVENIESLSGM